MNGNPLIFHAAIGFSSIYPEPAYLKTSFKVSGKQEYCPTAEWMKFHTFSSLLFPESVFSFPVSGYRFDHAVFCQLFQKLRCPGRLNINDFHHIRPSKDSSTRKSLTKLEDMAFCFGRKLFLNVRFSSSNVRFYPFNVRFFYFFEGAADVQCPVLKRMMLIQQKVP